MKELLKMELVDDEQWHGGVAYPGETVENFLREVGEYERFVNYEISIKDLNKMLRSSGIKTIWGEYRVVDIDQIEQDILSMDVIEMEHIDDVTLISKDRCTKTYMDNLHTDTGVHNESLVFEIWLDKKAEVSVMLYSEPGPVAIQWELNEATLEHVRNAAVLVE